MNSSTYGNTNTFPMYANNINQFMEDYLSRYTPESAGLFISQNVGENAEDVKLVREQDMEFYAQDKPQGTDAQRLALGTGYFKEIKAYRIGAQFNLTYEMRVAPRFSLGEAVSEFAKSVPSRMELDRQHFLSFSNATTYVNMSGRTVDVAGGDGLAIISATHPLAHSAITWSNLVPGNPSLSVTALESAETLGVTNVLNNYGNPVPYKFTHLIVQKQSPETCRIATEILRSSSLVTQANPGVVNTFSTKYNLMELSQVATNAMGVTDNSKSKWWFLAALGQGSQRFRAYELVWEAPHMNAAPAGSNNGIDANNDDMTFGMRARYGHGVLSARGIIGSFAS